MPPGRPERTGRRHVGTSDDAATGTSITDPLALITKRELAHLLAVDPWTVDRWRKSDPSFPEPIWLSGSTPRWKRLDIERWLASRETGGTSPDWNRTNRNRQQRRSQAHESEADA